MWLFSAMLIGIVGTILVERLHRRPDREAIWVPVRIDDGKSNRSIENYRR
jgi:hypothetical protein